MSVTVTDNAGIEKTSNIINYPGPGTPLANTVSLTATFTGSIINFSFPSTGETPYHALISCTKDDGTLWNANIAQGNTSYTWTWKPSDAGTYSCMVTTYKNNGTPLAVSSPITFTLAVDEFPPVITLTPETAGSSYTSGMTLVATVTDNVEVRSVNFSYFKSGTQPINIGPVTKTGDNYTASLPAGLEAGINYTLIITATDSSSNETTKNIPFKIEPDNISGINQSDQIPP